MLPDRNFRACKTRLTVKYIEQDHSKNDRQIHLFILFSLTSFKMLTCEKPERSSPNFTSNKISREICLNSLNIRSKTLETIPNLYFKGMVA